MSRSDKRAPAEGRSERLRDERDRAEPTRAGRALRVFGATSTGIVAIGVVAAATVLSGTWAAALDGPVAGRTTGALDVAVEPAPAQFVCAPPARLPDGLAVGDDQFDAMPVATESAVTAAMLGVAGDGATWGPLGGDAAPLSVGTEAAVSAAGTDTGTVLTAVPAGQEPLRGAGAATSITTAGDLRGLTAAACTTPSTSQWIVGGGTEVGSTAVLTVANPTERTATVALDVYGTAGQVALGSRGTFLVAPGQSVATQIEAVAPDQRRIAVHVRSTGARVVASVQTQALAGLLPRGVDVLTPGAEPATSVGIAGLVSDGQALDDPDAPVLRLLAPGTESGTARVSVFGPDGVVPLRGADAVALDPGVVTDVPLGGLPAGGYSVVVDADVPVVAAAGYSRASTTPDDAAVTGTLLDVAWTAGRPLATWGDAGQVVVPAAQPIEAVLSIGAIPATRDGNIPDEPVRSAVVRVLGTNGAQLAERELVLEPGRVERLSVADLAGELPQGVAPALVTVDAEAGGTGSATPVVWGLELTASDGHAPRALVATLSPTSAADATGTVRVRQVDAP
jgi:hypothetical protein